jgi:hypothetical protein
MSHARFTENETGIEVDVETVFSWLGEEQRHSVVTYPSGRRYFVPEPDLARHFSIVTPQEIYITGFGGVDDRPTKKQKEAPCP